MIILALDLTSEHGGLTVMRDGNVLAEEFLHSSEGFAHLVFDAIRGLLARQSVSLAEIDCFAAASGPGAFTGVRIGLAAVKGLADAEGKPAIGVSNLRALACYGTTPLRAPVLDARRGDVFAAIYNGQLELMAPEAVGKLESWLEQAKHLANDLSRLEFISSKPEWLRQQSTVELKITAAPNSLASAVARCAERDLRNGLAPDPAVLDANYVRRSDAELFWKDS